MRLSKPWIVVWCVTAGLLVIGCSLLYQNGAEPIADRQRHDFGAVPPGEYQHQFLVRNSGSSPLKILEMQSSCGCTVGRMANPVIAPNESAAVTVELNWRTKAGQQRESVVLRTDSDSTPQIVLQLEGRIIPPVRLEPGHLHMALEPGEPLTRRLRLIAASPTQRLRVRKVHCASDDVQVVPVDGSADGVVEFDVTAKGSRSRSTEQIRITFEMEQPPNASVLAMLTLDHHGAIKADPPSLLFSGSGGASKQTVRLQFAASVTDLQTHINSSDETSFRVQSVDVLDKHQAEITVLYEPSGSANQSIHGTMTVRSGDDLATVPLVATAHPDKEAVP